MQTLLGISIIIVIALVADGLYQLYTKFSSARETKLETKQSATVNQDEQKESQDESTVKTDISAYTDAVNKFKGDAS